MNASAEMPSAVTPAETHDNIESPFAAGRNGTPDSPGYGLAHHGELPLIRQLPRNFCSPRAHISESFASVGSGYARDVNVDPKSRSIPG